MLLCRELLVTTMNTDKTLYQGGCHICQAKNGTSGKILGHGLGQLYYQPLLVPYLNQSFTNLYIKVIKNL